MKLAYREMSLLLVDQVSTALDTLQDFLREFEFYRIWTAKTLEESLEVLRDKPVSLVISAWKLKPYTGLQLLERIHKDPKFQDLPFLIMIDRREKNLAEKIQELGASGAINLPLEGKDVRTQVEAVLERFIDPNQEVYQQSMARARKAVRQGKDSLAEDAFRAALAVKDDEDARLGLARILAKKEEYQEAEGLYFKVLRQNPTSLRAYLGLAELYSNQERLTEALKVLAAAVKATRKIKEAGVTRASIFYYMGELELRLKRLKQAMGYFEMAAEEEPENKELQAQIGDALVKEGHLAESEGFYQAALKIDPRMAHVYNRLGMAYRRQSKHDKAIDLFHKALAFHPEDEHLYYNLARCLWEMKQHEKAADKLGTALKLNPEFNEAQQLLNVVLSEMGFKVQEGEKPPQPPQE